MDIITSHINTDFDSLASTMAAQKIYSNARIVLPGSLGGKVKEFLEIFNPFLIEKYKDIPLNQVTRVIIVDACHYDRIGQFKDLLLLRKDIKVHIYDHHFNGNINSELKIIERVGAASTIFIEILQKKKILIDPIEATLLCLGIYEETGSLIFPSTTSRDLVAVSYLLRKGADLNIVAKFLKEGITKQEIALLTEIIKSMKDIDIHNLRIKIGRGISNDINDIASLAHKVMDMEEDIDAVFLLISMDDKILIIARSRAVELDVAQVLSEFNGGGHPTAASATIKDMPFEILEENLILSLQKNIKPLKTIKDIMTKPVITIDWDNKIKDAEGIMTQYGINSLPVLKDGKYIGILTRGIVEKALFHKFGDNICKDFTTTDAITVRLDTPLSDVEKDMIEQNQRFVAVLNGDTVEGAITRTDILRNLYDSILKKNRMLKYPNINESSSPFSRNIDSLIKDYLPKKLYDSLKIAGDIADTLGFSVYLVGGCVRDILMRYQNFDIDIVVEGDGIKFANEMAKYIGAKLTTHRKFCTANLINNDLKLDIATARIEYYKSPAVLPTVMTSSIKKDLYRRDFTINTLAVKLNKNDFGLLIDFFGAQRDLKDKVIKVLHNLSFVEDPTRAFRAVRLSKRFGFKITKHTENLIKIAVQMKIFDKLSGSRIYEELKLIFNETNPIKSLKKLGDYGLLKVIHQNISYSLKLEGQIQSIYETISWFNLLFLEDKYDKAMLYTMALLYNLEDKDKRIAISRLMIGMPVSKKIMSNFEDVNNILKNIKNLGAIESYYLLKKYNIETLLFTVAFCRDKENQKTISNYLLVLKKIKPVLTGNDLKAMGILPGPIYCEIFNKILNEKILNKLNTKEEEIEFVKLCYQ